MLQNSKMVYTPVLYVKTCQNKKNRDIVVSTQLYYSCLVIIIRPFNRNDYPSAGRQGYIN